MADIWQRTRILLGDRAMEKLQHSHILVVVGGVGSYAAEAITRLGVGHITIVDSDRIETSNLNRQLPAIQYPGRIQDQGYTSECWISICLRPDPVTLRYHPETSQQVFAHRSYDYVLDAIDSFLISFI